MRRTLWRRHKRRKSKVLEHLKMIDGLTKKHLRKFPEHKDYEDLKQTAILYFLFSEIRYDPNNKTKFEDFMRICISRRFRNALKSEWRRHHHRDKIEFEETRGYDPSKLTEQLSDLSNDAKIVCGMVISAPEVYGALLGRGAVSVRRYILQQLRSTGWSKEKANNAIRELKEVFSK